MVESVPRTAVQDTTLGDILIKTEQACSIVRLPQRGLRHQFAAMFLKRPRFAAVSKASLCDAVTFLQFCSFQAGGNPAARQAAPARHLW